MARLFVGATEAVFSAKLNAPTDLWTSGRVKGKSRTETGINRRLDELRASALSHHRDLSATRETVTAEEVKTLLLGMAFGQETLLAYFRAHNEKFDKRVGVNRTAETAKSYWGAYNHLSRFLAEKYNLSDIPFTALDRSFIEKYDLHLRLDCHLSPASIVGQAVRLGTIINRAIADGIITANPFAGYEPKRPERKLRYLNDAEINKLMTTPLTSPSHFLIRDLFLFSCHTGIPYGDMSRLTANDLSVAEDGEVWIKNVRGKTGVDYEVPLHDLPMQIIERYRDTMPNGRLLPMYDNREMNADLREIAEICGINRKISFHSARHTFSTNALSHGIPIETVSRMLGHSRIDTTQIYAKVTDNKIEEDTRGLDERLAGKFQFAI
jgi:site-specific recombinase XerD